MNSKTKSNPKAAKTTMMIGVITNDEAGLFQRQVITGIRSFLEPHGCRVIVASTGKIGATLDEAIGIEISQLDGVLVIANALTDDATKSLYEGRIPISLISHQVPDSPIPAVIPDNTGGIAQLVNYLTVGRGRRRIAFIQGDLDQNDGKERQEAFLQSLMRHYLPVDQKLMLRGDFLRAQAIRSMERLIKSEVEFDAVAAADYLMAIAAMEVLERHGIAVPEKVCVVGFGDGPEAAEVGLTTVGVDVERIGWHAARQLLGQVKGLEIRGVTLLATTIVERASC